MQPLVNIAVMAARSAGNFIMRHYDRADQLQVERKSRNDFVSMVDRGAEAEIIRTIHKNYPDHAILAEESGEHGKNDVVWIIDPLDGTTNFLHRLPHFAVSIGIQVRGRLEHGVIYAPCTQDLYCASRGDGATLNNRKLRVSGCKEIGSALIGTGVPLREEHLDRYMPMMRNVAANTAGVRRAGAAALDLAYVAAGRLDGFWELNLNPWDIAAGIVLVQEAGGVVRELDGGDDVLATGNIVASTTKLMADLENLFPQRRPAADA
ncbi:inositol monophosphatase [Sinimarinibacterium sp. CAU 1509]|uniref:inositol monophosphatase family protein n=1 Tax=Sinimarinibacterium sp. CAU 1509 TaxID=2562283 RepID=UPI0010AD677D|nr:inositol monophosphatase family protein [Sinimarinibacterium sp. CAU 1509]TJY61968.1 inositol monophosphatase [Sinimarinibacterium sp. CAU 1509]